MGKQAGELLQDRIKASSPEELKKTVSGAADGESDAGGPLE